MRVQLVFRASGTAAEAEGLADGHHPKADVAFLRLVGPLPEGVASTTLGSSVERESAPVRAFGYPEVGEVKSLWSDGRLVGRVTKAGRELLQLRSTHHRGFQRRAGVGARDGARHRVRALRASASWW